MRINQLGQSILEVSVSLGLIIVIITILTITTLTGLKNSQFAKNQVLASSYSEEGIELIRSAKQRECPVVTAPGTANPGTFYWADTTKGTLIWNNSITNPIPESATPLVFQVSSANPGCNVTQSAATANGETLSTIFNRKIQLERLTGNPNVIRVTVIVGWSDYNGAHESKNVSLVTNY